MSDPSRVRIVGPLVLYSAGFRVGLEAEGYQPNAVSCQLQLMAHVSRWMDSQGLDVGQLTADKIEQFLVARRQAGYTLWLSVKGVAPLVGYLRALGVVPAPKPVVVTSAAERCLEDFGRYLAEERGLVKGTIAADVRVAGLFLASRPVRDVSLDQVTPAVVVEFVVEHCQRRGAAFVTAGLRAFLRYCHLSGLMPRSLVDAVPTVASRRLATLPKAVDGDTVQALLSCCDRVSPTGKRSLAVLMLLVRLGLRAGEVAGLRLEDLDWRAGEVLVRGKGRRQERLPLPCDVGEAVAGWLEGGRPRCAAREVITRLRAPHGPLTSSGIGNIVYSACGRAGVARLHPHQLRHTAATEMLVAGAGLAEIGQVLRHRSLLTTAIYAKVDRCGLAEVASPWPGASRLEVAR